MPTTPSDQPEPERRALRPTYAAELDQLRLQVEVLAVRVDQNLERMRDVLHTGDVRVADRAVNADDDIDATCVSLTERCYDLLAREQPVASDLRFIVSVLRVIGEFERIGDLSLRVAKLAPEHELLAGSPTTFDVVLSMADEAIERYRSVMAAWSALDPDQMQEPRSPVLDALNERLAIELLCLDGPDAVAVALRTLVAGRSLERIADHADIIAARLCYLVTGDAGHLAQEVR